MFVDRCMILLQCILAIPATNGISVTQNGEMLADWLRRKWIDVRRQAGIRPARTPLAANGIFFTATLELPSVARHRSRDGLTRV
jgi:hypothetical protein